MNDDSVSNLFYTIAVLGTGVLSLWVAYVDVLLHS